MTVAQQVKLARKRGVPLISIHTPDPAQTMSACIAGFNGTSGPVVHWDTCNGVTGLNEPGKSAANQIGGADMISPITALMSSLKLPPESVMFFANAHRIIAEVGVSQAVWNLRDAFKKSGRCLILMSPSIELPVEIQQDLLTIDEPLPSATELHEVVRQIYISAESPAPSSDIADQAVDALSGLAAFPAEQSCALSFTKAGLDIPGLWERKRRMIEQTKGLTVWRGGETFEDIQGYDNAKSFMSRLVTGRRKPRGVIFIDEIEKQFAGMGSVGTGDVTTEMGGTLLTWMQDHEADGVILIGPPGSGKSMLGKATGNTGGVPTIGFDLTAMKASLVGDSGANLRQALKVVQSVTQGNALFVATCNSIGSIPPELRRRFKSGTFFFDLPTAVEREAIWDMYLRKYEISGKDALRPMNDDGWTGAEISNACYFSWNLGVSVRDAAGYIVPVAKSAADQIQRLRDQAAGRFISASYPGVYEKPKEAELTSRRIELRS